MQSYFEINVACHGVHYFATAPRSLQYKDKAYKTLAEFRRLFPENQGYKVTMTYWEGVGHECG